ncbi:MAG: orotidine-5'-phosphate decarboxylase [Candidatus Omnitrophica bacterium]|nr:orotidine-5'-phosphate decarboxylase [Candidatus Omnitrophota bacterium]MCM8828082.1 orotidine-5'-phosphate decarboxylase [Candidatus Omnitrophota bacterium]
MTELIVSLDVDEKESAEKLVEMLGESVDYYKIGAVLLMASGMDIVKSLEKQGKKIFFDLKFFDIPNTVEHAVYHACRMRPFFLTVHVSGGPAMLKAAIAGRNKSGVQTRIIGVTILTSFNQQDIELLGFKRNIESYIERLATLAFESGIDGIVCSARDLEFLRKKFPENFLMVCPGIRPGISLDDQKRVASVRQAARAGADYIVVGRPILESKNPLAIVQQIKEEIKENETQQKNS